MAKPRDLRAFIPVPMPPVSARPSLPASSPAFLLEGRFDLRDPAGPLFAWAGSRLSLDFSGDNLVLHFAEAKGQNFFNVELDGLPFVFGIKEGGLDRVEFKLPAVPGGRHRLRLFKRSEATAGTVRFIGATLDTGADQWTPSRPPYRLRLLFLGDSITVGACNEDGETDQWDNYRSHNHALSYAALVSDALKADHQAIAVSGMGIVTGYVEPKAPEVWDRLLPVTGAPRANLSAWTPDVACLNFGENDDSFTRSQGQPFPTDAFVREYVALVRSVRAAYPRAAIVLLRGGMHGGRHSEPLIAAWNSVITELRASDSALASFAFDHWSANHPRVADARKLAAELTAWLRAQPFMAPHLG